MLRWTRRADGAQWYTGTENPSESQGNDGDFYIDTDDYILYQKTNGNWVVIMTDFGKPGADGQDGENGQDGNDGQDGADGTSIYIGYDGYVWAGKSRSNLQLTDPMEDTAIAESSIGLYGNEYFEEYEVDTSNYVAIMSFYYENLELTGYSQTHITEIQFYAKYAGFVCVSKASLADVIEAREKGTELTTATLISYTHATKGLNTVTLTNEIELGSGEVLLIGGDGSNNIGLYAYSGVTEYDTYGNFAVLDGQAHSDAINSTDGVKDKLAIQISAYAYSTTTTEGTPESSQTEDVSFSGAKTGVDYTTASLSGANKSNYSYVAYGYDQMAGATINSVKIFPYSIYADGTEASGLGSVTLYVADISNGITSAEIKRTITLSGDTLSLKANEWNEIDLVESLGEAITLGENQTIAFGATGDILYAYYLGSSDESFATGYKQVFVSGATDTAYKKVWFGIEFVGTITTTEEGTEGTTETVTCTFAEHIATMQEQEDALVAVATESAYISGMKVSILGDSISTFAGVSNSGTVNDTISSEYLARYCSTADADDYAESSSTTKSTLVQLDSVDDTWWMKTINECGLELLVNNSWRGTKVLGSTGSTSSTERNDGWYSRCTNLHDNTLEDNANGEEIDPDIIVCYLGTNDYLQSVTVGSLEAVDFDTLITEENGVYSYTTPTTFAEAYVIMLHKMQVAYPNATIFCFTLFPDNSRKSQSAMESYNAVICDVAECFNCPIVDLYNCGITFSNCTTYLYDNVHPNSAGIELISQCFTEAVLEYFKPL